MTLAHNRPTQHIYTADNHQNGIQADIRMRKRAKANTEQNETEKRNALPNPQKIHRQHMVQMCSGQ